MSRPSSRIIVALLLAMPLAGVGRAAAAGPPAAGEAKVPAPPPASTQGAAPIPEGTQPVLAPAPGVLLVPSSEFRYDSTDRRDPFKSLLELKKGERDVTKLPPLQQFDVEQATVVGVIVDAVTGTQAMIRAPGGQTFVVRVGTIVGKNDGEIVEITLKGIRILEKFLDFMNRETRKETFLKSHPSAVK